jgi:O-acetyl-ADP-ribose deacetylase (regulator of RNase III)
VLKIVKGDIFSADIEAIVNPVNCEGVSGAGLALAFKRKYIANHMAYADQCAKGQLTPGRVFVFKRFAEKGPKYIINFPTKNHWKDPSTIGYIHDGLSALTEEVVKHDIKLIAMPALGCGLGGLSFDDVKAEVDEAFKPHEDVLVYLYDA